MDYTENVYASPLLVTYLQVIAFSANDGASGSARSAHARPEMAVDIAGIVGVLVGLLGLLVDVGMIPAAVSKSDLIAYWAAALLAVGVIVMVWNHRPRLGPAATLVVPVATACCLVLGLAGTKSTPANAADSCMGSSPGRISLCVTPQLNGTLPHGVRVRRDGKTYSKTVQAAFAGANELENSWPTRGATTISGTVYVTSPDMLPPGTYVTISVVNESGKPIIESGIITAEQRMPISARSLKGAKEVHLMAEAHGVPDSMLDRLSVDYGDLELVY